jgi:predicted DNA-binding protein with PD1-like motif
MRTTQLRAGRQVAVVLEPGEEVLASLAAAMLEHELRQAYVPVLFGAFTTVEFIATCRDVPDEDAPLPDRVDVAGVEGSGSATIAWDVATDTPHVHLHAAVGIKRYAATAHAGHVLRAVTHYMAEAVLVEVLEPNWDRAPDQRYGLPGLFWPA